MNSGDLREIEEELIEVTDDIDFRDVDYQFNRQIDGLRAIIRKIGAKVELLRLREVQ